MLNRLARSRGLLAARAALAVAFGAATLAWAEVTVAGFAALFAAYAMLDGLLTVLAGVRFRSRARDRRGLRSPLVAIGAAGMTLGLAAAAWPGATMRTLLSFLAVWALATGAGHLGMALRARGRLPGARLLATAGAAGVALALLVGASLAVGEVRVGWEVGLYGLAQGVLLGAFARRVRGAAEGEADEAAAAAGFATVAPAPVAEG